MTGWNWHRGAAGKRRAGEPARIEKAADGVGAWILAVPLVLINVFAAFGQSMWSYDQLHRLVPWGIVPLILALGLAVTLETIALVLSGIAHTARMAGDAALPAQFGAFAIAAAVGGMNYSHWSQNWAPTGLALVFAGFSMLSPWLWGTWSKARHRAALRERGQIDPRAVRFSLARWVLYPRATFTAYRRAVWVGETDPARAVLLNAITKDSDGTVTDAAPDDRGVDDTPAPISVETVEPAPTPESPPVRAPKPAPPAPPRGDGNGHQCGDSCQQRRAIAAILRDHPNITRADVASRLGKAERTLRRHWPDTRGRVVSLRTGS